MKLRGKEGSKNIDDRRGRRGGMSGRTKTAGGLGLGAIIIAIIVMLLGGDPSEYLGAAGGGAVAEAPRTAPARDLESDDPNFQIVSKTLRDNEKIWGEIFPQAYGRQYQEPVLVVFEGQTRSSCGSRARPAHPAVLPAPQRGRSIAPPITRFTSIFLLLPSCANVFVLPATSPWPTLWPTRWGIIYRTSWDTASR